MPSTSDISTEVEWRSNSLLQSGTGDCVEHLGLGGSSETEADGLMAWWHWASVHMNLDTATH